MNYCGPLAGDNLPIVDNTNEHIYAPHDAVIDGQPMSRGAIPRDWQSEPYGASIRGMSFDIIDRKEWKGLIESKAEGRANAADIVKHYGLPPLDQNGTNYCWCNAPVQAVMVTRAMNGQGYVPLSPASVGGPIKGFRNQGGWGLEAIKWIQEHGVCPTDLWPNNGLDRKYYTPEAKQKALEFRATEWEDIPRSDFDALASALLNGFVCPIGIDRWSHEVLCLDLAWTGREFGVLIYNSWGKGYGKDGMAVLTESWLRSFDSECLRVVTGDNG